MNFLLNISSRISYRRIGVFLVTHTATGMDLIYYQLEKKGKTVDIISQQKYSEECVPIAEKVPNILCIQGTGLVHRILVPEQKDIAESIPNINISDYFISLCDVNSSTLAVLYRNNKLQEILDLPGISHLPILGINPGLSSVLQFTGLFDDEEPSFNFAGHSLLLNRGKITGVKKQPTPDNQKYKFAGSLRPAAEVIVLCCGLIFFTQRNTTPPNTPDIIERTKEFTARKLSEMVIKYGATILFSLLLINFLFFDSLNNKYNDLRTESKDLLQLQKETQNLKEDFNQKKLFINQNNVPENYAYAFYADRLSSFSTEEIRFNELAICPTTGKIKEKKLIAFRSNILVLKGSSSNSLAFSNFIDRLNTAHWVSKINKQIYQYNKDQKNAEFELEITLNHAIE